MNLLLNGKIPWMLKVFHTTFYFYECSANTCNDCLLASSHLSKFNEWVDDMKRSEANYIDNRWESISYTQLWIAVKFLTFVHFF